MAVTPWQRHRPGPPGDSPPGGPGHDRALLRRGPPPLVRADVRVALHGIHTDGERAAVEATMTATLADGSPYSNDYCFVVELRNGLIHRVREYVDTARGHRLVFGPAPARDVTR
ncbi:nuclear transport factor 2 family protein [Streptomyces longispororuber]|nr:nuclear transport factor 2 family protein [Streptomyces longispororuber]